MQRAFTSILCNDVETTARFYEDLLGMNRAGDFGWFVLLGHPELPHLELGIWDKSHDTIPQQVAASPSGVVLTFVVDNVEDVHQSAINADIPVIEPPSDMPYGQRRMLIKDPAGTIVDISSLMS